MEEAKAAVRDKIASVEHSLKLLHECQTSGADYKALVNDININLEELKEDLAAMQSAAKTRLARSLADQYGETYHSLKRELATLLRLLEETVWKKQLLGQGYATVDESFSALMMREERSLDSSVTMTSGILDVAAEVRQSLSNQKKRIEKVSSNVVRFAETLPGVNVLLRKISRRQRFNAIVVSVAVAVCLCVTLYLTFS